MGFQTHVICVGQHYKHLLKCLLETIASTPVLPPETSHEDEFVSKSAVNYRNYDNFDWHLFTSDIMNCLFKNQSILTKINCAA